MTQPNLTAALEPFTRAPEIAIDIETAIPAAMYTLSNAKGVIKAGERKKIQTSHVVAAPHCNSNGGEGRGAVSRPLPHWRDTGRA